LALCRSEFILAPDPSNRFPLTLLFWLFLVGTPTPTNIHTTVNPQTKQEAIDLATAIRDTVTEDSPSDVALFVPFPFMETVQEVAGDKFVVGAEVSIRFCFVCWPNHGMDGLPAPI
jgi:hypothetical protein